MMMTDRNKVGKSNEKYKTKLQEASMATKFISTATGRGLRNTASLILKCFYL